MREIQLSTIPNQSLSVRLEDQQYDIILKQTNDAVGVTIIRNNVILISNVRACGGTLLLPYYYLENGNFFIATENNEIPNYLQFGTTQTLIYVTIAELAALRAGV